MNSLTPGPLQINPDWMTGALRRAGAIRGARVVDMTCKPVGNGLVGDSYRFDLTYEDLAYEEAEPDAPASVIGKFPAADPDSRRAGSAHLLYLREVWFYRDLARTLAINTPHPFVAEIDRETDDFILILEDLAPFRQVDLLDGCSLEDAVIVMRRARVVLQDNASGVSCDLTFSARTAAIQEARQTLWRGARRVMDATRFDQFGRWSGVVRHPDGEIQVDEAVCLGAKDRSWSVRNVGEREVGGAPAAPPSVFFLWAPLVWDDHISHAIFFDGPRGEALIREGIVAPLYPTEAAVPGIEDGKDQRMATARHRVNYVPGTRLARSAEIDLIDHDGRTRTIALEPILKFQMKGLGYGHPQWGQGMWKGELEIGGELFDPQQLDSLAPEHLHAQQVVRANDGERTGVGVLEQICLGPYEPSGFTGSLRRSERLETSKFLYRYFDTHRDVWADSRTRNVS